MRKVYAKAGESPQQVGGTCPDGWVEMEGQRPTAAHIATEHGAWIIGEPSLADVYAQRLAAYRAESDPLFLEWQYDGTPESEQIWRDKVAEIKARIPLPKA